MAIVVRNIMATNLITVDVGARPLDAVKLMNERKIGSIIVTKNGKPVGILTERDVLAKVCDVCAPNTKIKDIMSTPIITIGTEASLDEAATLMMKKNIRRLLITERGKIVGIITQKDVLRKTFDVLMSLSDKLRRL